MKGACACLWSKQAGRLHPSPGLEKLLKRASGRHRCKSPPVHAGDMRCLGEGHAAHFGIPPPFPASRLSASPTGHPGVQRGRDGRARAAVLQAAGAHSTQAAEVGAAADAATEPSLTASPPR